MSLELTRQARLLLAEEAGFRPHFIGHILVEILLDAELIAADPSRLDAYYRALDRLDAERVTQAVGRMGRGGGQRLSAIYSPVFPRAVLVGLPRRWQTDGSFESGHAAGKIAGLACRFWPPFARLLGGRWPSGKPSCSPGQKMAQASQVAD